MRVYEGNTFADVYSKILKDISINPEYVSAPRGLLIKEITNAAITINDPAHCLYKNNRRGSQLKYIAAELVWYFTGRNDIGFISKFAKFWEHLDNGNGTVNSAYGNLIFTESNDHNISQYVWAIHSLIRDKDSRQAILHFNKPSHQWFGNKDFVCTLNGIFQIRDNYLNFTVDMRSNDLILGTPTDVAFFCLLQIQAYHHLKKYYPDLKLGTYTHIMHSMHIYEKHFKLIEDMLAHDFTPMSYPSLTDNIININGIPLNNIKEIELAIDKNLSKPVFTDNFHEWLSDRIFSDI